MDTTPLTVREMSGPEDPRPDSDWRAFRAARDRFFAKARPQAMDEPPVPICPDAIPDSWPEGCDDRTTADGA